jgi:hypothetical protein
VLTIDSARKWDEQFRAKIFNGPGRHALIYRKALSRFDIKVAVRLQSKV